MNTKDEHKKTPQINVYIENIIKNKTKLHKTDDIIL